MVECCGNLITGLQFQNLQIIRNAIKETESTIRMLLEVIQEHFRRNLTIITKSRCE